MNRVRFLLIITCTLLSGCLEKEIVDDINIVTGLGYDYLGEDKILGTALVPVYLKDQPIKNITYSSVGSLSREILLEMQRESSVPLVTGSLEVVLYGKKMAEKEIIVDSLQRDASVGARLYLAVVDGKAQELLKGTYGTQGNAVYISNLIKHNIKSRDVPETNLQLFFFDFYQHGKTAYLPQLKKTGSDKIEINGISLFDSAQIVDVIPADKMFFFKLLVDKYSEGFYTIHTGKGKAEIRSIKSKHSIRLTSRNPYEVTIHLSIKGIIREYSAQRLTKEDLKQIEAALEKKVTTESLTLTERFKQKGIDPVGFGHFIKSKTRGFDFNKWQDEYKNLTIKVTTDVSILETGVVE